MLVLLVVTMKNDYGEINEVWQTGRRWTVKTHSFHISLGKALFQL